MSDMKKIFFSLSLHSHYPGDRKDAGVAVAAVMNTGQQVFAEIRADQYGFVWTDYYTLHPEGIP